MEVFAVPHELRGKVSIAGIGYAGLGSSPGFSSLELLAQATKVALVDSGLKLTDIDGLCCATFYHFFPTLTVAEYLGIRPTWSNADMVGGSSFQSYVLQAAAAIHAGLCRNVLIAYGSNARSSRDISGLIETPVFEQMYKPPIPLAGYAMAAARHMHVYGTTRRQLAAVAVAARDWARINPAAGIQDALDLDAVATAPMIADPLSKYDCCLVSDGGGALILTSTATARDLRQPPVVVLGGGAAHWHREISQMPDLTVTAATESGRRAYEMAGIGPADVDVVQLYDAFTINTILFLEDLGFCRKGEGGSFVSDGKIAPGGDLPVNTNGGGLSFVHPGMYGLFCLGEAAIQLRRQAGKRQVAEAEIAVSHGNGGTLSHQCTTVLGSLASL
ncbi:MULTISPECIES: acetyl-CoA acetyltransferase [unclassified Bradyrhizobium]|uniref:acetyl-CoA acetyltransferase n=1 Tax=unclassified Bradyrhizobium TaxID=2631580 RepID=UPI001FFB76BE|nr:MULTISPECIES: acetyl-CoA acetyltransferase [unclassified Bradyrhizobium]